MAPPRSRASWLGFLLVIVVASSVILIGGRERRKTTIVSIPRSSSKKRMALTTAAPPRATTMSRRVAIRLRPTDPPCVNGSDPPPPVRWPAANLYLPLNSAAARGFQALEAKQLQRDPAVKALWDGLPFLFRDATTATTGEQSKAIFFCATTSQTNETTRVTRPATTHVDWCQVEVPECEFWIHAKAPTVYRKCCTEHYKLKRALFHTMDVLEAAGIELFLDSGTLLSSVRDGGASLLPWETDVDVAVVDPDPARVIRAFSARPRRVTSDRASMSLHDPTHTFYFQPCATRESKNQSRNGKCKDAHYVYWASTADEASVDTSRVEIWPFWPQPATEDNYFRFARETLMKHNKRHGDPYESSDDAWGTRPGDRVLVHPTRRKLTIPARFVEPLLMFNSSTANRQQQQPNRSSAAVGTRSRGAAPPGWSCQMWQRAFFCPRDSIAYLDHEYGLDGSWRTPKTIHWGDQNVLPWK